MKLNEKIFSLLSERNISQKAFAASIGASDGNVTDWKKNRSSPKPDVLTRIADFFGVSVDYLLGRETISFELSPEEQKLIRLYRIASPTDQTIVELTLKKYAVTPTMSGESAG